jgi:uncharacterized membrane-anchored protein YitT (DUF2179 family)
MKKFKSFIITLLIFIAVTALSIFLMETKLLELFLIGISLLVSFIVLWYVIYSEFFKN